MEILTSRSQVVSKIIRTFPGGRKCAATCIGLKLKKFDNHAYENSNSQPLTDRQIHQLEQRTGSTFLPNYVATMYGGLFVPLANPETLDNVELYSRSLLTSVKRGAVDLTIAKALENGSVSRDEAAAILNAHNLHMAARHAEVLAAIKLHQVCSEAA